MEPSPFRPASPTGITRLERAQWSRVPGLERELADLVAPSYVDASGVMERELAFNDLLYLVRDAAGALLSFFLVRRGDLSAAAGESCLVYMGLSATRDDTKNSGIVRSLYAAFAADVAAWQLDIGRRIRLWFTTATPSAYYAAQLLFMDIEPRPDGSYNRETLAAIAQIRRTFAGCGESAHPFVLPGVASGTRYSDVERGRIARLCERHGFRLFEVLDVQERRGDRLVVTCSVRRVTPQPSGTE